MENKMDPLDLFEQYYNIGAKPAFLESAGPASKISHNTMLGIYPSKTLEVFDGILYVDSCPSGTALDIFEHLISFSPNKLSSPRRRESRPNADTPPPRLREDDETEINTAPAESFFPAWVGFFSYEFARHFKLKTKMPQEGLPEAAFYYYEDGHVWNNQNKHSEPLIQPSSSELQNRPSLISSFTQMEFIGATNQIKSSIENGNVYQVNLSRRFQFPWNSATPVSLYRKMRATNPSPFMGILVGDDWSILSGSPERLVSFKSNIVSTRPIAGTRKRGKDVVEDQELEKELLANKKERAEHAMLVDLSRNDVARVSVPGSVALTESYIVERYSHVMHLVSEVVGQSEYSLKEIMASLFPGGSITGAPKERVMEEIAKLEQVPRGAYTGSLGYVSEGFGVDFNILIRSVTLLKDKGFFSSGAGIVIDSDPFSEFLEVEQKSLGFKAALETSELPPSLSSLVFSAKRKPNIASGEARGKDYLPHRQAPKAQMSSSRCSSAPSVLFIENHDSFSYNIIHYLQILGAAVTVLDHNTQPANFQATHIVIGPGPGEPTDSGCTMEWTKFALEHKIPLLGICLGHQALGVCLGATLVKAAKPVHGESHSITHSTHGIFSGLNNPTNFTRYHSLCLKDVTNPLSVQAWTNTGEVMAIAHRTLPAYGVQFHPESFLSDEGLTLLGNFLKVA